MPTVKDWNAALSSEVFREYAKIMVKNEEQKKLAEAEIQENKEDLISKFEELQENINNSPKLKKAFLAIQNKLMKDPDFAKQVDASFAQGVMLLNLEEN